MSSISGRPRWNSVARAVHLEAHQLGERRREAPRRQVVVAVAEAAAVLLRQVDAADVEVAGHVLPEVGQLQRRADAIGQSRPLRVERLAQIQHQPADRVGGVAAVVEQLLEGLVALDALVLLEGREQVEERLAAGCGSGGWSVAGRHDRVASAGRRSRRAVRRATRRAGRARASPPPASSARSSAQRQ